MRNGSEEPTISEINICAEALASSTDNIAEVLIHEMVHYANALDGVRDCSANQYHNKHFRQRAEEVELLVEKSTRGWSDTSLSDELRSTVHKLKLNDAAFSICRHQCEAKKQTTEG